MYVYTYVFKYVYIYIYVCIHIYIHKSAPTRLGRGNANFFRCADLKKSADFILRRVRQLEKVTYFQSVRPGKIALTWTWVFCVRPWKSALTWTWLFFSRISTESHEGGFGQIVARVVLCALLLAGLFRTILVGVAVDHGSHLYIPTRVTHKTIQIDTHTIYRETDTSFETYTDRGCCHLQWFRTVTARCAYTCCSWPLHPCSCTIHTQKKTLTYGPKGGENWSRTPIHQEVHGPIRCEWWSQHTSKYLY